ncbi:hypothetical protein [Variovorax sp. KK3]|uniref:hypothetical protein n=1 Tax=Variovorax sp. KK3 TaxID=1855728 RepID=UPI00097BE7E0|nr:hypothetical protein [Variovorax sp. KK3]
MLRFLLFLICAAGSGWLVYTFGFGMLVALGALGAGYALVWGQAHQTEVKMPKRAQGTAFADAPVTRWD